MEYLGYEEQGPVEYLQKIYDDLIAENLLLQSKISSNNISSSFSLQEVALQPPTTRSSPTQMINTVGVVGFDSPTTMTTSQESKQRQEIDLKLVETALKDDRFSIEGCRKLLLFKEKHGNCNVPYDYPQDTILGHWVNHQRHQYTIYKAEQEKGAMIDYSKKRKRCIRTIRPELIQFLDSIGFEWDAKKALFDEYFLKAQEFQKKANFCANWKETVSDKALRQWILNQEQNLYCIRNGLTSNGTDAKLTPLQMYKLQQLGINGNTDPFITRFEQEQRSSPSFR